MIPAWQPGDFAVVHSRAVTGILVGEMQRLSGVTDPGRTGWVHALVGLPRGRIGEAMPGGFRCVNNHYTPDDICWSTGRLPGGDPSTTQRQLIIDAAERLGAKRVGYSPLDYVAIAAHQWHLWAPGLKGFIETSGHMICSQAVDWCYQEGGYHLFDDLRWPGYVRPYDLAMLIGAPDIAEGQ